MNTWIGVDLDGTLAQYDGWNDGAIGAPIPAMVERVRGWLAEGKDVRIFTARVGLQPDAFSVESQRYADAEFVAAETTKIQDWCEQHIGVRLPVTNVKDFGMVALYDDRAFRVEKNTGRIIGDE